MSSSNTHQTVDCEKTSLLSKTSSSEVNPSLHTSSTADIIDTETKLVDEPCCSSSSMLDRKDSRDILTSADDDDKDTAHLGAEDLIDEGNVVEKLDVKKTGMQVLDSGSVTTISDLNADLLHIVFQKLPSVRDLIKTSLVSKKWTFLMSDMINEITKDLFGLIYCTCCKGTGQIKWKLACLPENCLSPLQQSLAKSCMNSFSLFLPDAFLSCSDGLLLFFDIKGNSYYIRNPYTDQWIRVHNHRRSKEPMSGVVSSRSDSQIVSLPTLHTLKVYNAVTEAWNAYRQEFMGLGENDSFSTRSFLLGNSVYRISAGYLLIFNKKLVCSFTIELPPPEDEVSNQRSLGCLGVSKELLHYSCNSSDCVKVWCLLEGHNTWVLKYSFNLDLFLKDSCWCKLKDSSPPRVFSYHPFTDKLYIGNLSNILSYDPGNGKISKIVSVDEAAVISKGTTHVFPLILSRTPLDVFGQHLNKKSKTRIEARFAPYTPGDNIRQNFWEEISFDIENFAPAVYEANLHETSTWTLPPEPFGAYGLRCSHPTPKNGKHGILSLDIHGSKEHIVIGGADADALVLDKDTGCVYSRLCGHLAKVNAVKFMSVFEETVATGSADKSVRLWKEKKGHYSCIEVWSNHVEEVTAVTNHPSYHYIASASLDSTWCLYDIKSGLCIHQVKNVDFPSVDGYCCASFHPSGTLLGTGTSSKLKLWDVRTEALAAVYNGHTGPVTTLSFAKYAYLLATAAGDGVKIWDIRMNSVQSLRSYKRFELEGPITSVDFDDMGHYLAVAGNSVKTFEVSSSESSWSCLSTFPCTESTVVKLWYNYAAVGTSDGHVNIYGVPPN